MRGYRKKIIMIVIFRFILKFNKYKHKQNILKQYKLVILRN